MLAAEALEDRRRRSISRRETLATETSDVYAEDTEQADIQTGQLDASSS